MAFYDFSKGLVCFKVEGEERLGVGSLGEWKLFSCLGFGDYSKCWFIRDYYSWCQLVVVMEWGQNMSREEKRRDKKGTGSLKEAFPNQDASQKMMWNAQLKVTSMHMWVSSAWSPVEWGTMGGSFPPPGLPLRRCRRKGEGWGKAEISVILVHLMM